MNCALKQVWFMIILLISLSISAIKADYCDNLPPNPTQGQLAAFCLVCPNSVYCQSQGGGR